MVVVDVAKEARTSFFNVRGIEERRRQKELIHFVDDSDEGDDTALREGTSASKEKAGIINTPAVVEAEAEGIVSGVCGGVGMPDASNGIRFFCVGRDDGFFVLTTSGRGLSTSEQTEDAEDGRMIGEGEESPQAIGDACMARTACGERIDTAAATAAGAITDSVCCCFCCWWSTYLCFGRSTVQAETGRTMTGRERIDASSKASSSDITEDAEANCTRCILLLAAAAAEVGRGGGGRIW